MANQITEQRLTDTTKKSTLKYVFLGDGSASGNTVLVDVSTLAFALNTAGGLMISSNGLKPHYKTAISRIQGQVSGAAGSGIKLSWHRTSGASADIVTMGPGSFDYSFEVSGDSALILNPDTTSANGNGDIVLSTTGTTPAVATIIVHLKKNNEDYDAGQTADPMAFNKGLRGM